MDPKAVMASKRKINELAISHNKLTTLVACLLNEINYLKKEMSELNGTSSKSSEPLHHEQRHHHEQHAPQRSSQRNPNKFPNFNDLRAEEILQQLSINTSEN